MNNTCNENLTYQGDFEKEDVSNPTEDATLKTTSTDPKIAIDTPKAGAAWFPGTLPKPAVDLEAEWTSTTPDQNELDRAAFLLSTPLRYYLDGYMQQLETNFTHVTDKAIKQRERQLWFQYKKVEPVKLLLGIKLNVYIWRQLFRTVQMVESMEGKKLNADGWKQIDIPPYIRDYVGDTIYNKDVKRIQERDFPILTGWELSVNRILNALAANEDARDIAARALSRFPANAEEKELYDTALTEAQNGVKAPAYELPDPITSTELNRLEKRLRKEKNYAAEFYLLYSIMEENFVLELKKLDLPHFQWKDKNHGTRFGRIKKLIAISPAAGARLRDLYRHMERRFEPPPPSQKNAQEKLDLQQWKQREKELQAMYDSRATPEMKDQFDKWKRLTSVEIGERMFEVEYENVLILYNLKHLEKAAKKHCEFVMRDVGDYADYTSLWYTIIACVGDKTLYKYFKSCFDRIESYLRELPPAQTGEESLPDLV